jgi:hypothetical protein
MTATKHTPGPWIVEDSGSAPVAIYSTADRAQRVADGKTCTLYHRTRLGETAANGSLIAASPDLLAACNAAADLIDENANIFPDGSVAGAVWGQLDAAIARAEGKTP